MPIYEYLCRECGSEFEKLVGGTRIDVACPSCASGQVMRRLSLVGVKTGGRSAGSGEAPQGGGCCGGGCGCH